MMVAPSEACACGRGKSSAIFSANSSRLSSNSEPRMNEIVLNTLVAMPGRLKGREKLRFVMTKRF